MPRKKKVVKKSPSLAIPLIATAVVVATGLLGTHLATPYIALYNAESVLKEGSRAEIREYLEEHVDFDTVREEIRQELLTAVKREIGTELQGNPFAGLAIGLGNQMIDAAVDEIFTASSLAGADFEKFDTSKCEVDTYSFGKATISCSNEITFLVERRGLTWTVSGLDLKGFQQELQRLMRGVNG